MTASTTPVLVVDRLGVRNCIDEVQVVHEVSFTLRPGEVLGIVGESGSGKTITCRALLGLLPELFEVDRGTVHLQGRDTRMLSARDWTGLRGSTVSAVFQDPATYLNPSTTIGKQLAEVLRVKAGLRRRAAKDRAVELLDTVRIRDAAYVAAQFPHELSGGMLQRVLIAMAIASEPAILIADEATTALDVTVQAEVIALLHDLKDRLGLALVVVSHDLAVVAQLCDELIVMRDGRVVEQGPAQRVLDAPEHEYTRLLLHEHERFGLERFLAGATATGTNATSSGSTA